MHSCPLSGANRDLDFMIASHFVSAVFAEKAPPNRSWLCLRVLEKLPVQPKAPSRRARFFSFSRKESEKRHLSRTKLSSWISFR